MRPFTEPPILLNAGDLAKMLNVSKRSLSRYQSAGVIPEPVRIGSSVRWNRDEIESWLAAGCPKQNELNASKEVQS